MSGAFTKAIRNLDEEAFQLLYGRWDPLEPEQVADLLSSSSVRWWIAGGRAARANAPARHHDDTDVAVRAEDLDELRKALSPWHLWEANSGTLRPLLPDTALTEGCEQLWARRNARLPCQLDLLLDRSGRSGCSSATQGAQRHLVALPVVQLAARSSNVAWWRVSAIG